MIIQQTMMERAHVWVGHDKPEEKQPIEPCQPPPPTKSRRQSAFTTKAMGTWASENKGGRILGQTHQQSQGASYNCPMSVHVCALVTRGSGHACGTKHPECEKDRRAAKQDGKKGTERDKRRWSPAVGIGGNSHPTIGQKQTAEKHQSDRLSPLWRAGIHSLHHDASRIPSARAPAAHRPPQDTTDATETEAEHRTEMDVPSGSENERNQRPTMSAYRSSLSTSLRGRIRA